LRLNWNRRTGSLFTSSESKTWLRLFSFLKFLGLFVKFPSDRLELTLTRESDLLLSHDSWMIFDGKWSISLSESTWTNCRINKATWWDRANRSKRVVMHPLLKFTLTLKELLLSIMEYFVSFRLLNKYWMNARYYLINKRKKIQEMNLSASFHTIQDITPYRWHTDTFFKQNEFFRLNTFLFQFILAFHLIQNIFPSVKNGVHSNKVTSSLFPPSSVFNTHIKPIFYHNLHL